MSSFTDHSYGENKNKDRDSLLHLVKKFIREIESETESVPHDSATGNERNDLLISALEALITNLQQKLKQLKSQRGVRNATVNEADYELVQVHADNVEIERRIAAFMQRKQREVDDINKLEFCSSLNSAEIVDSCARTDAVYIPSAGSRSHVKVSRVVNRMGPQAVNNLVDSFGLVTDASTSGATSTTGADVEERVRCMETHLNLDEDGNKDSKNSNINTKMKMFERIQRLEERILTLESISPEYVHIMSPSKKRRRQDRDRADEESGAFQYQDLTMAQIDEKIFMLKQQLLTKAKYDTA